MASARTVALSDPNSEAYRLSLKMVMAILNKGATKSSARQSEARGRIHLDSALAFSDVDYLRKEFGYEIKAQPQGIVLNFPFLSAYSRCVTRLLEEQKSWKGDEVVHVNGDVRQLVVRGLDGLKVVRYYSDPTLHEVFFEEDAFVQRTVRSKNAVMQERASQLWDQMVEGDGSFFSKKGSDSGITGDTVYFDPMRVRCGLRGVAAEVVRRKAYRAKGWIPFSMDVLRAQKGELFGGRVTYVVDTVEGKVLFFEKGRSTPAFVYQLADYFSYVTREPFVCDGAGFVIEMHGSPADRLDWILTRVEVEDMKGVCVEKVPVWCKSFEKPGLLVSLRVCGSALSVGGERAVLRDDPLLFQKAVGSLVGGTAPITMKAARNARAVFRDQVMLPSGGVVLPRGSDGIVEELLARAVYRRAVYAKAAMVVEEMAHGASVAMTVKARDSMAKAVCSIMWATGKTMVSAFSSTMAEFKVAALDDTWDVAVIEETPSMWLNSCWRGVVSSVSESSLRDPTYWSTGVDKVVWEAASSSVAVRAFDGSVVAFFEEKVVPEVKVPCMGQEREEAASKIAALSGAESRPAVVRVVERPVTVAKPGLTVSQVIENPVEAMKEEFDREFPGLSAVDVDVRPYLVAESDRVVCPSAPLMKVPLIDQPVKPSRFLSTGFFVGVSGPRPRSVAEVVSAFEQRVGGAPSYQWDIDLENALATEFERFASVCLKKNWKETVNKRVAAGYMYPTEDDVRRVVSKMSPSNVRRVLNEDFRVDGILMTVLKAMVKREPKDRQDLGVAFEHKPNQTIMYQDSKITNACFSAALGKFHDCLDDVLRDGFLINPRVDKAEVERVWNSVNRLCVVPSGSKRQLVDVDISQCDKSQTSDNVLRYLYLLCQFGFADFSALWSKMTCLKRAGDPTTSVLIEFINQIISGYFNTISANSCIVSWATVNSVDVKPEEVERMSVSGDDVVASIVTAEPIDIGRVSNRFLTQFNFDSKVNISEDGVLYWCGRLGVVIDGYTFFVKDPGRARSSFFKSQGPAYDPEEAWQSFLDDTAAYEFEELVSGVAEAYARRRGLDFIPIGTARAIATLRRNKKLFVERFEGIRTIQ